MHPYRQQLNCLVSGKLSIHKKRSNFHKQIRNSFLQKHMQAIRLQIGESEKFSEIYEIVQKTSQVGRAVTESQIKLMIDLANRNETAIIINLVDLLILNKITLGRMGLSVQKQKEAKDRNPTRWEKSLQFSVSEAWLILILVLLEFQYCSEQAIQVCKKAIIQFKSDTCADLALQIIVELIKKQRFSSNDLLEPFFYDQMFLHGVINACRSTNRQSCHNAVRVLDMTFQDEKASKYILKTIGIQKIEESFVQYLHKTHLSNSNVSKILSIVNNIIMEQGFPQHLLSCLLLEIKSRLKQKQESKEALIQSEENLAEDFLFLCQTLLEELPDEQICNLVEFHGIHEILITTCRLGYTLNTSSVVLKKGSEGGHNLGAYSGSVLLGLLKRLRKQFKGRSRENFNGICRWMKEYSLYELLSESQFYKMNNLIEEIEI